MKKRTLGLCGLLAAVAITGSSVSGTYAKYVANSTVGDTARVAKWGFNTDMTIDLFDESYLVTDPTNPTAEDVKSSENGVNVVAPGTSGAYVFTFSDKNVPETNYQVTITDNGSVDNIGRIKYYLKPAADNTAPGKTTFNKADFASNQTYTSITDLVTAINNNYKDKVFAANTKDGSAYIIGWEWEFEEAGKDTDDTNRGNDFITSDDKAQKTVELNLSIEAKQTELAAK